MFQKKKNKVKDISSEEYEKLLDDMLSDPAISDLQDGDEIKPISRSKEAHTEDSDQDASPARWRNSELNVLTDEFSTEKLSDESIDEKLLLALGYLSQNEDADILDRTVKIKEQVFGLNKEFSDVREIPAIKERFEREKNALRIRLIASSAISFLIFLYPFFSSIISHSVEFFDSTKNFLPNMLIVLAMLLISAAFSGRDLIKGFLKVFIMRPNVYSPSAILISSLTLLELILAFAVKDTSSLDVSMYAFPASVTILLPIISDIMRMNIQESTFDRLTAGSTGDHDVFHLSESENGFLLEKNGKDIDFYKRTKMQHSDPKIMNFVLLPGLALSLILGLFTFFSTKLPAEAFHAAACCLSIVIPGAIVVNYFPFFKISSSVLDREDTSVVGRSSIVPIAECNRITINESELFDRGDKNRMTMDMYEIDCFFDVFYYGACVLKRFNTPLASLFLANAEALELSDDVKIEEMSENGITALVDGSTLIQMGSKEYMQTLGLTIPSTQSPATDTEEPSFVLYIAKDGTVISRSDVFYAPGRDLSHIADMVKDGDIKLSIRSCDFVVTKKLISSLFSLDEHDFELIKHTDLAESSAKRSSLAVSVDNPSPLFALKEVCLAMLQAEKAIHTCSIITAAISAAVAILLTIVSLSGISQYLVLLLNALMLLPSFVMTKLYTSHFLQ